MEKVEPQYERCFELLERQGRVELGAMTSQAWRDDPKHLTFTLARYKFVSKMLGGKVVAEIGCGDAWASQIVRREVRGLDLYDLDSRFVAEANKLNTRRAMQHDITLGPLPHRYGGVYMLDVFEHVANEISLMRHLTQSVTENGVLIIGTPSLESQVYASPLSKAGHVNCKSGADLRALMYDFFENVFLFSMNDEIVHTGYYPMAHYLLALCCGPRRIYQSGGDIHPL
jgi:2-polyprenyl-3-methyl-5-hydroxy-6-metoxy-1,4-benzoquinol methylase